MIKAIVAIDEKRGMATDTGIPWNLPSDKVYYRQKIENATVLMGYGTYLVSKTHPPARRNLVATTDPASLEPGFEKVTDARDFFKNFQGDIWNFGGAGLLATTFDLVEELYVTTVEGDFRCTKFLPEYKNDFTLIKKSPPQHENGLTFYFEIWRRKPKS